MNYWIMTSERSDEYELSIDGLPDAVEDQNLNFCEGNIISPQPKGDIVLPYQQAKDERKTDNLVCAPALGLVINNRIKAIFDLLKITNIQTFPLQLLNEASKEIEKDYCIANIVGKYACVDFDKSSLELYDDGDIEFIDSLTLSLDPNTDYGHIFRLAEYHPLMVISTKLKETLEAEKITGLKIYAPEDLVL